MFIEQIKRLRNNQRIQQNYFVFMDFIKELCEICFNDESRTVEMNCKHKICLECFKIAVLPKEICPFCKQIVNKVLIENKIQDISEFEKPIEKEQDFFEESHFELVNEQFFDEDIRILMNNQNRANQYMMRTIRQTDQQFNLKWFIYDQISEQISNLKFRNSLEMFQEINNLNICLNLILSNNWDQIQFKDYKEAYNLQNLEENYQFIIQNKVKKNKKRKQKQ
ncbi:unnamed protein product [Paramecium sonneborni]|uniref:RING-type domain-containing protein n=1 Tax=Paramecium sonneborni TaxID=65129 RepID=A0A8S1K8W1_9CILI|nr:unnamed protein product [Paramecium sonneborni]